MYIVKTETAKTDQTKVIIDSLLTRPLGMHELAFAFGLFAQTLGKYLFLTNDADLA